MVFDHLLVDGKRFTVDDYNNLTEIKYGLGRSCHRKQPGHIYGSISACDAVGTYCGLTPGRYLHEGNSFSGDGNLGACMSSTAHRGAHELPGIVSSANNASAMRVKIRSPCKTRIPILVCPTKVVMRVYFLSLISNMIC